MLDPTEQAFDQIVGTVQPTVVAAFGPAIRPRRDDKLRVASVDLCHESAGFVALVYDNYARAQMPNQLRHT